MTTPLTLYRSWRKRLFNSAFPFFISDLFAIVAAYFATLFIRFYSPIGEDFFTWINVSLGFRETAEAGVTFAHFYLYNAPRILCILAGTVLFLYGAMNLYEVRRFIRRRNVVWTIVTTNLLALGLFYGYFYLTRNAFHPRSVFASMMAVNAVFTVLCRMVMTRLLDRSELAVCRVLLVGDGPEADFIDRYITLMKPAGLTLVARLPTGDALSTGQFLSRIKTEVEENQCQMILCADKRLTVSQIMQLLELGESLGQEVKVLSDKLNVLVNEAGVATDFFMELPLVHFAVAPYGTWRQQFRQSGSRILSVALLGLTLPFMILTAFLIKVTSRGPVFFMQERIGINRLPFRMYKFRTMNDRADELQAQIEEFNESGEGLFKIKRDPRVTGIGRFLRRFSLDELPQLINVVRGEMTLVGPRPLPRRDFEHYYEEWHYSRHSGLPGLTCLWQVSGRSDISFHNMCILDDYYLRNQNFMLDLKIVFRTVAVVLFAKGAY
ncbi:MAG: exopolysaccharide biosynthesis polyprenyl glycosylphosphotransferase [bacterium]